jgi:hypothetical protein
MHDLIALMRQRIVSGLQRKSLTKPSRWAEKCRVMGPPFAGPWTFRHHPWLKEMHDSESETNVGQKSAQMGYTETLLNLTFFHIDVKGQDCLYVLPSQVPDATDFSSGRFDPALEQSPHLRELFSDVRNVGHKRAGNANLYVRGSKSRSGLKSVPIGFIALDEVDEMKQKNVPLALERVSGQIDWQAWMISTPTLPDVGINKYFKDTTQEEFFFSCPSCNRWTELIFPDCLIITADDFSDPKVEKSHLICKECKTKLDHETKIDWLAAGKWISKFSDREKRGFHISQLYSMTVKPARLAESYLRGQRDPADATEFHNSKLGYTFTVTDAQLTDQDINGHRESYKNGGLRPTGLITMGVDVGSHVFHVEIDQWDIGDIYGVDVNTNAVPKVLYIGKIREASELDRLMQLWNIAQCVIDANPERRTALQFANRFFGIVRLCIYAQGVSGKDIQISKDDDQIVLVDRTSWMDLALSRFRREEMIMIPADTPFEYVYQLKVPTRVYRKDKDGNNVGYYENRDLDDHYAHARTYSEIALKLVAPLKPNRSILSPL